MRKWIILGSITLLTIVLDQLTKTWILDNLPLYETIQPIPALVPLFQITHSTNTGAAFGIFPMAGNLIFLVSIIIVGGMLWYFREAPAQARFLPVTIGMVIGGALGNLIDRVQYGHVIDFIHYQIPNLISNVSNIADHAVVLGVILIIGESLWRDYRTKQPILEEHPQGNPTGQSVSPESTLLE
jgi:signal peptidase II